MAEPAKSGGIIDWLKSMIPGYSGYQEFESRRDDDRKTRKFLIERLQEYKRLSQSYTKNFLQSAQLDQIAKGEKLRADIDMLQQKIEATVDGNSNWFTQSKPDAAISLKMSQLDAGIVADLERLGKFLADPEVPSLEPLVVDLDKASESLNEMRTKWERRNSILRGET
ncbi:MAG: hypothetical protein JNK90_07155 [Planctomycetaceae bacterium]|nr:hypothetical protein [Planctomycetaceae bacterium]MBN8602612.1 hypothetical protein [Planctomycetota bacterium]